MTGLSQWSCDGSDRSVTCQGDSLVSEHCHERFTRGETADHLFTVGNARPLDQAVQHATTEMLRWLCDALHLDELGAHILLGHCAEYDTGNVFDPAYTMVCKIGKNLLPAT